VRFLFFISILIGCGDELPAASFIDKLRVLAVQTEPPEVPPGTASTVNVLAVEPIIPTFSDLQPVDAMWIACHTPPGALQPLPCAVDQTTIPPLCQDDPANAVCIIGPGMTVSYTADTSTIGADGKGEILLTVVVSDQEGGAIQCLKDIQTNGGKPKSPDRCVVAFKRLVVNANANAVYNHNPQLTQIELGPRSTPPDPLDSAHFVIGTDKSDPTYILHATRADDAAEIEDNGNYEELSMSWFTTSGKIDGGRSAFDPAGCASASDCPKKTPASESTTSWIVPKSDQLGKTADSSQTVRFWAVLRDDRGGVSWMTGTATPQ
jgi:hypothetical protein